MTGLGANFQACRWRSAPISSRDDPAVGPPSFPAMSEHPRTRPARTAVRAAQGGWLRDLRPVRLVSTRNPYRIPGGPPLLIAGESDRGSNVDLGDHTGTPGGIPQFVRNHQNRNQGKDYPMQNAGPTMRQEDLTQASPARSAIAHRTLSTPHARATSCGRSTGLPVR